MMMGTGLTYNPRKMKDKKAMPGVDIDAFLDCSLEAVNDENAPLKFRIEQLSDIKPARNEFLGVYEVVSRCGVLGALWLIAFPYPFRRG